MISPIRSAGRLCAVALRAGALAIGMSSVAAQPVTLAQAVDAAWQRASESAVAAGALRRAQADGVAASAHWAAPPSLELSQRTDSGLSGTGARETEAAVAVPLWLPGQRGARQQVAQADTALAQAQAAAARWQVAGAVRSGHAELQARVADLVQMRSEAQALLALSRDVERRVQAGDLAPADALAAKAEWLQADIRVAQAAEQLAQARLHWRTLTGLEAETAPESPPSEAPEATRPVDDHPLLREARLRVEAAQRKVELASASRRAAPELVARARQDVGGRGVATVNSWGLALRLPLGTDDRNQPLQAAVLSDREVADAQLRQLQQQLAAAAEAQRLALSALDSQAVGEQQRASLLRERAELIGKSFRAGESPLPDLLRAMAAAHAAESAAQRLQLQRAQVAGRLQHALGIVP